MPVPEVGRKYFHGWSCRIAAVCSIAHTLRRATTDAQPEQVASCGKEASASTTREGGVSPAARQPTRSSLAMTAAGIAKNRRFKKGETESIHGANSPCSFVPPPDRCLMQTG